MLKELQMMDVWIVKFHREVGESLEDYVGNVHMTYFGVFIIYFYLFILHMTKVSHMMFSVENMRF